MLEKIQKALFHFLQIKHFVFRFQYYTKEATIVNDTNVIEYEFINVGDNPCEVNGMMLFPMASNLFYRIKLDVRDHEQDTTIYRTKFVFQDRGSCSAEFCAQICPPPVPPAPEGSGMYYSNEFLPPL